jgi:hypothetical protein
VARIATVAGRPILEAQLDERIAQMRRGPTHRHLPPDASQRPDLRRWVAHELVTEAILAHEAKADPGIAAAHGSMAAALFERVTADVAVPEAAIRAYYERNADLFAMDEVRIIRHLVLPSQELGLRAAANLRHRTDGTAAARDGSPQRETRAGEAELLEVRRGELTGRLEDAIFAAAIGEVVGPLETEHGWHVARVAQILAPRTVPYREARRRIEAELLDAERLRVFDNWLQHRRHSLAVMEPGYEHPGDPAHGLPRHRH